MLAIYGQDIAILVAVIHVVLRAFAVRLPARIPAMLDRIAVHPRSG